MAFDPFPRDVMARGGGIKSLPEVNILQAALLLPAIALPAVNPLRDPVFDKALSVTTVTLVARSSVSSALIAASSSMRLLVVSASPPLNARSFSTVSPSRAISSAPQPPGPGFPEHAPSV